MKQQAAFMFIPLLFAFNMFGYIQHHEFRFPQFSFSSPSSYRHQSDDTDREDNSAQNNNQDSVSAATGTSSDDTNTSDPAPAPDTSTSVSTTDTNASTNTTVAAGGTNTQVVVPPTPGVPNTGVDTISSSSANDPAPDTLPVIAPPTTMGASDASNSATVSIPPPLLPSTLPTMGVSTIGNSPPPVLNPTQPQTTQDTSSPPPPASSETSSSDTGTSSTGSTNSTGEATGQNVFSTGGVTFRFDDGWQSQYDVALPALRAAGVKGTFYIITRQLLDQQFSGFMSSTEVKQMAMDGEEIGDHTQTHPHLPTLSTAQQQAEIVGAQKDLEAMGIEPHTFSYPYGEYTAQTTQIVKDAGFSSAVTTVETAATPSSDPLQIESPSYQVTDTPATIEAQIQNAMQNHQWLVMTFHRIDTSGDQYSITPSNFQEIVNYVANNHIPVVTVSEGASLLQ